MYGTSLQRLIESHGAAGFYNKIVELLNERHVTPDDFSYRELAEACGVLSSLRSLPQQHHFEERSLRLRGSITC